MELHNCKVFYFEWILTANLLLNLLQHCTVTDSCLHMLLWNLSDFMISPTSSFLPIGCCMFPLQTFSHHQTGFVTFPHSSPTPCSLRWNPALVSFSFHLSSAPPLILRSTGFHFISHMFSTSDFAATVCYVSWQTNVEVKIL